MAFQGTGQTIVFGTSPGPVVWPQWPRRPMIYVGVLCPCYMRIDQVWAVPF